MPSTKAKKTAGTVKLVVKSTAAQSELVADIAKRLRCTPEEYIAAATLSEIESWQDCEQMLECSLGALRRFVDEGEVPTSDLVDAGRVA